jgi:hypothetical protein
MPAAQGDVCLEIGIENGRLLFGTQAGRSWFAPRNLADTDYQLDKEFGFDATNDYWYVDKAFKAENGYFGVGAVQTSAFANWARFGHVDFNDTTGFGYMQFNDGRMLSSYPTGQN